MTKEVQNAVNYYFCDVCHYCFEAESLPDRCPDCGKTVYQNRPAIRPATEKEVQDLLRARDEECAYIGAVAALARSFSDTVSGK